MEESNPIDIKLSIRFLWEEGNSVRDTSGFPAGMVVRALDAANDAFYLSELDTMQKIASALKLSPVEVDAMYYRMSKHHGSALVITQVSSASLVIEGSLTALFPWLLSNTLSESLKDAWKESTAHKKKLMDLLKTDLWAKVKDLPERIKKKLTHALETYHPKVRTTVVKGERIVTILMVIVPGLEMLIPPSYATFLQSLYVPGSVFRDILKDGTEGPEMVVLPEGSFEMGDVEGMGSSNELPIHTVLIARPFALGRYPVTFDDYNKFCRATGRDLVEDKWGRGRLPVINVSWHDAATYCEWLSDQTGETYRLPSEAEWEYAARGGTRQETWAGTSEEAELGEYAWYETNSEGQAHPVGEKRPNSFGIYDLSGNIWEWVEDCWNQNYEGAPSDGTAWLSGACDLRVLRGGSWDDDHDFARCADRYWADPNGRNFAFGFRCARTL